MDRYDARIQELTDAQFEINGLTAPLAHDDPERLWYQRRASANARERRILVDGVARLRELDRRMEHVERQINTVGARQENRGAAWRSAARIAGVLGGLLLLLSVWWVPSVWVPLTGFALVGACVAAWRRARTVEHAADPVILQHGQTLEELRAEHAGILAGGQSASPRKAASTPEKSVTSSHAATLELLRSPSE